MSAGANGAAPRRAARPPGFPATGSSLKVTLQRRHADVAGLAVGMEPAPPPPSSPSSSSSPFIYLFIYFILASTASKTQPLPPAGPGQRQRPPPPPHPTPSSQKKSLINNDPFLIQTFRTALLLGSGEAWTEGGLGGKLAPEKSLEFPKCPPPGLTCTVLQLFQDLGSGSVDWRRVCIDRPEDTRSNETTVAAVLLLECEQVCFYSVSARQCFRVARSARLLHEYLLHGASLALNAQ